MGKVVLGGCLLVFLNLPIGLQTAAAADADDCAPSAGSAYVCGPVNAEDLVRVPDTRWVLASGMGPGGGIVLIDARTRSWSQLYTGKAVPEAMAFGSCDGAPALASFVTHGLHLRAGSDRHSTLYVVGHGGREAIEVFDVDASGEQPVLTWQGCIPMPHDYAANSVTSLGDGTVLATVLMHPGQTFGDVFAGKDTGAVYRFSPGDLGFSLISGSELPGNNGIEVSADEREIYVVSTGLSTISVFSNTEPMRLLRATPQLDFGPDNIHRAPDGQLITAGPSLVDHDCGEMDVENMVLEEFAACPRGTVAATFDPVTLEETERWSAPPDPRFSNATMALEVGDEVWVGSFSGDRIGILANEP